MKRFALAALAVLTLLGLSGCDILGGSTNGGGDTTSDIFSGTGTGGGTSSWWIKGSFDGWTGVDDQAEIGDKTVHFLSVDSLNSKLLSFEMTAASPGLRQQDYKFVLMNDGAAGSRIKFSFKFGSETTFANNTVYSLVNSSTSGASDIAFTASANSYTIKVDITDPSAPRVKLVPGSTASTPFTEQELVNGLVLKGSVFNSDWSSHTATTASSGSKDGVYDASAHTLTFSNLTAVVQNGEFGIDSVGGWLVTSDVTADASAAVTKAVVSTGSNPKFLPVGNSDAKYQFVITIDAAKTVAAGRYTLAVSVTSAGSTAWPGAPAYAGVTTTDMTDGTGAGSAWVGKLGTIGTAIYGTSLVVKVTFAATADTAHNLWLLLDNADISTGSTDLSKDLTTGWGDQGLSNTAAVNYDLVLWGWGSGKTGGGFNYSGANTTVSTADPVVTDVKADVSSYEDADTSTIWFKIPLSTLHLDASHNHLKAAAIWGDNKGIRSVIPAITPNDPVTDITSVATATLSGL